MDFLLVSTRSILLWKLNGLCCCSGVWLVWSLVYLLQKGRDCQSLGVRRVRADQSEEGIREGSLKETAAKETDLFRQRVNTGLLHWAVREFDVFSEHRLKALTIHNTWGSISCSRTLRHADQLSQSWDSNQGPSNHKTTRSTHWATEKAFSNLNWNDEPKNEQNMSTY